MAVYDLDNVNEEYEEEDNTLDNMLEACEYMINVLDESRALDRYLSDVNKHNNEVMSKYRSYKEKDPELAEKYLQKNYKSVPGHHIIKNATYSGEPGKNKLNNIYGSRKNYDTEAENDYHRAMSFKRFGELDKVKRIRQVPNDKLENKAAGKYKTSNGLSDKYDPKADNMKKAEQKKALKEACLYILSRLDDIDE